MDIKDLSKMSISDLFEERVRIEEVLKDLHSDSEEGLDKLIRLYQYKTKISIEIVKRLS